MKVFAFTFIPWYYLCIYEFFPIDHVVIVLRLGAGSGVWLARLDNGGLDGGLYLSRLRLFLWRRHLEGKLCLLTCYFINAIFHTIYVGCWTIPLLNNSPPDIYAYHGTGMLSCPQSGQNLVLKGITFGVSIAILT